MKASLKCDRRTAGEKSCIGVDCGITAVEVDGRLGIDEARGADLDSLEEAVGVDGIKARSPNLVKEALYTPCYTPTRLI